MRSATLSSLLLLLLLFITLYRVNFDRDYPIGVHSLRARDLAARGERSGPRSIRPTIPSKSRPNSPPILSFLHTVPSQQLCMPDANNNNDNNDDGNNNNNNNKNETGRSISRLMRTKARVHDATVRVPLLIALPAQDTRRLSAMVLQQRYFNDTSTNKRFLYTDSDICRRSSFFFFHSSLSLRSSETFPTFCVNRR